MSRAPSPCRSGSLCATNGWRSATADVFVLGYFSVAGAGKYSVDEQVLGGELNFYQGQLDKVFDKGKK